MALIEAHIYSEVLMKEVSVSIILPLPTIANLEYGESQNLPSDNKKYQTLWMLHSAASNGSKCIRSSMIEMYAKNNQLAVVIPNLENSCGHNIRNYGDFFTYLTEELPAKMRKIFPLSERREDNFIEGTSIGGYTAYMVALRRPDLYSCAISLGGGLDLKKANINPNTQAWYDLITKGMFGKNGEYYDSHIHDIVTLADDLKEKSENLPHLFAAVGKQDVYYEVGQGVIKHLQDKGYNLTYYEDEGGHDWIFWDKALKKAIEEWLPLKHDLIKMERKNEHGNF